ncbi:MAG: hypothetical protein E7578_01225 [Ruminococcaceae bacterium]|nr:hypothetical protein [Oscillospiraceae bacterium]
MAKIRKTSVVDSTASVETEAPANKYYLLISERYMRAKYFLIIFLVLFLAIVIFLFKVNITYANLMYLMRDLNSGDASYSVGFDPIKYDEQDNMNFTIFRDELAVIGNRSLKFYNTKGKENRNYELGYLDPVIVSSDKYLVAYDIGTDSYSVFTSLAKVNSGIAEGNIESAHVNDKGEYLLVCRSDETKYVVYTFDSSFRAIAKYYKNRYITSAAISEDSDVVIASFNSDGTGFDCEIELYRDGQESPAEVYKENGVFPVKCGIWDNGAYYVICTDRVLFFDNNGRLVKNNVRTGGYTSFSEGDGTLALAASGDVLGDTSEVSVFDSTGELLYNNSIDSSISSLALSKNEVFVLADEAVYMISLEDNKTDMIDLPGGGDMIFFTGSSALVCRRDGAEGIDFSDSAADNVK